MCGVHLNLNSFCSHFFLVSQAFWNKQRSSYVYTGFLFAIRTSDVFSPFSSSTVVADIFHSQGIDTSLKFWEFHVHWEQKGPEKSIRWAIWAESLESHCLARNQRNFKETSPWYSLNADQGTLYKWARARRTRHSPADFVNFTGSELRTLFYEVLTLCIFKLTFMGFMCKITLKFRNPKGGVIVLLHPVSCHVSIVSHFWLLVHVSMWSCNGNEFWQSTTFTLYTQYFLRDISMFCICSRKFLVSLSLPIKKAVDMQVLQMFLFGEPCKKPERTSNENCESLSPTETDMFFSHAGRDLTKHLR